MFHVDDDGDGEIVLVMYADHDCGGDGTIVVVVYMHRMAVFQEEERLLCGSVVSMQNSNSKSKDVVVL